AHAGGRAGAHSAPRRAPRIGRARDDLSLRAGRENLDHRGLHSALAARGGAPHFEPARRRGTLHGHRAEARSDRSAPSPARKTERKDEARASPALGVLGPLARAARALSSAFAPPVTSCTRRARARLQRLDRSLVGGPDRRRQVLAITH